MLKTECTDEGIKVTTKDGELVATIVYRIELPGRRRWAVVLESDYLHGSIHYGLFQTSKAAEYAVLAAYYDKGD